MSDPANREQLLPRGLRLRLAGLPVVLAPSGFLLIAFSALAGFVIGGGLRSLTAALLCALCAGLGVPLALAGHELGHALAARRLRMQVIGISIRWLGAGTYIDGAYPGGRSAWRVAACGPLASLLLAALGACGFLAAPTGGLRLGLALFLGINLLIFALNLVPVAPLDGYRLLLGLAWARCGDKERAEQLLAKVSYGCLGTLALAALAAFLLHRGGLALALLFAALIFDLQRRLIARETKKLIARYPGSR